MNYNEPRALFRRRRGSSTLGDAGSKLFAVGAPARANTNGDTKAQQSAPNSQNRRLATRIRQSAEGGTYFGAEALAEGLLSGQSPGISGPIQRS